MEVFLSTASGRIVSTAEEWPLKKEKVIKAKRFFELTKNYTKARTVGQNTDTSWLATAEQDSPDSSQIQLYTASRKSHAMARLAQYVTLHMHSIFPTGLNKFD